MPALRPTFLTAVPTVLERVRSSVDGELRALRGVRGAVARPAFSLAYAIGDAALRHCGVYGSGASIAKGPHAGSSAAYALVARAASALRAAVFAAPRAALGGGVRFFLSGGAPQSPSTHRYLQVVFGVPALQGYVLTEACSIGARSSPADLALGRCRAPKPSGLIKLVPWSRAATRLAMRRCRAARCTSAGRRSRTAITTRRRPPPRTSTPTLKAWLLWNLVASRVPSSAARAARHATSPPTAPPLSADSHAAGTLGSPSVCGLCLHVGLGRKGGATRLVCLALSFYVTPHAGPSRQARASEARKDFGTTARGKAGV